MKKQGILVLVLLFVFAGLLFFGFDVKASTTPSNLITVQGAQVRTAGSAGIRFVGKVDASFNKEGVTAYGLSIAFGKIEVEEIEVGGTVDGKSVLSAQVSEVNETNNFYINLTDIPTTMYGQDVTARTYVVRNGEIEYADSAATRNLGQVALAVKAAGQTSDLITSVVNTLKSNYVKVYQIGNYIYINDSIYEYEPTKLSEFFVDDFNKVTGESITTMSGFAYNYKTGASATGTKSDLLGNKLYSFFNKNNQEMLLKWGWVLDYICEVVNNNFMDSQVELLKTKEANVAESISNFYGMQHILARFEAFFTREKAGHSYTSSEFIDGSLYNGLAEYMANNSIEFPAIIDCKFIELNKSITLPNINPAAGYEFDGYKIGENLYNDSFNITSSNVTLVPQFSTIDYSIKFMDGSTELTDLAKTYTINDLVVLPELSIEGFNFLGWYDNDSFSGNPITTISKGTIGEKIYYAKLEVTEFVNVNVTYNLNGGYFLYETIEDAVTDFITDYNASMNTSYTVETYAALGKWAEISSASNFLYKDGYNQKWTWLIDYLAEVGSSTNKAAFKVFNDYSNLAGLQSAADGQHHYRVAYELRGWVGQYECLVNTGMPSTDYSSAAIKEKSLAAAKGKTSYIYQDETTLLIPKKEGFVFKGWLSSIDSQIVTTFPGYSENPGNITYTAQWGSAEEGVYTITYKYEDGTIINGLTPTSYSTETNGSIDLPAAPEKAGYEFLGWYDGDERVATFFASDAEDKVFVAKYQSTEEELKYSFPNDMTHMFTAVREDITDGVITSYGVSFSGITGLPSKSTQDYNWSSLNPDIATVSSWGTFSPASSGFVMVRAEYKNDSSIVIYGIYKMISSIPYSTTIEEANTPVYYTVTFTDENGNTVNTQSVKEGEAAILPNPPAKSGYTFYGWSANHYPILSDITLEPIYIEGTSDFVDKKVSILGDSISTFRGYIPDGYAYFYPDPTSKLNGVNDTWWMKVINKLGMKLLKNNSWAGSCVSSGTGNGATVNDSRLAELVDGDVKPDIILLFMGSNDCGSQYVELSTFTSSYKIMLDKMIALCPDAEIYIMTLPPSKLYTEANRVEYNKVIINYATEYNLPLINMDNVYGGNNCTDYLVDSAHLNLSGMEKFAELVVENLLSKAGIK